jgi:putative ABC transport system permease protein
MESLLQDLRYGLRQLLKERGFSAAAILTFTLGIGATAAMFTVVSAVLLGAMPYRDPGRLVILGGTSEEKGELRPWPLSQKDFADWRERGTAFSDMSVFGALAFNLEQGSQSQRLSGELVDDGYFRLLGLEPALGRFFLPEEDSRPMEQYVVVLGYGLWQGTFGADRAILGRKIQLNGRLFQVVGVGPRGFGGLTEDVDLWVPSMLPPVPDFLTARRLRWAAGVARLKPGVSLEHAREQLGGVAAALAADFPDTNQGIGATVRPIQEFLFGRFKTGLLMLTAGSGILLLIACINVASLLLARAAARQRSLGVRVALGASRLRLVRQLLTESVLLALVGAVLGMLLAHWGSRALIVGSGIQFPSFVHVGVDWRVIAATVGLAVLSGLAFGLVPLFFSLRADLTGALARDEKVQRGRGWNRFRGAVVIAQVALVLTLSVSAGLMAKGFQKMVGEDLGFHAGDLLTLRLDPRGPKYADEGKVTRLLREEYLPRIAALPGVERVAMANPTIPTDGQVGGYVTIEDHDSGTPDGTYVTMWRSVTADYFSLLGIPIVKGRAFDRRDVDTDAVIVSRMMADQQWPGQDPLGKRLKTGFRNQPMPWLTVVGVAADVRHEAYWGDRAVVPDIYLSLGQFIRRPPLTINFLVKPKAGVSTTDLTHALHRELTTIEPELADFDAATLAERISRQTAKSRFQLTLIGLFTALALILSTIGIYGVVSYGVTEQKRDIAIRMSLGADRGRVLRMVVGRGARQALLGLLLGLAAVVVLGRYWAAMLYQTSPTDPLILGGVSLLLFLVTLVANYLPARRATIRDPMAGLRLQ